MLMIGIGIPSAQKLAGGGPSLSEQVETFLSGTTGFAIRWSNNLKLWQESTKTNQVTTPGQVIGAMDTSFGTTTYLYTDVAPAIGTWTGTGWQGDGIDDRIAFPATSIINNVGAAELVMRVKPTSLAATIGLFALSTNNTQVYRFGLEILTDGAVRARDIRLDGEAENTNASAAGVITAGTAYTIRKRVDWAGTGKTQIYVNETLVVDQTLANAVGNTSATNSARWRSSLGLSNTLSLWLPGIMGDWVFIPRLMTAGEIASAVGFVEEFAI
jgi:hypothetical protein